MDEYFDYAVRLDVLLNFFKAAPNVLVKHKLCDLAFTATLRSKEMGRVTFTPESDDDFVYFYTRAENAPYADSFTAGASTGVEIGAEDEALAKEGQSSGGGPLQSAQGEPLSRRSSYARLLPIVP